MTYSSLKLSSVNNVHARSRSCWSTNPELFEHIVSNWVSLNNGNCVWSWAINRFRSDPFIACCDDFKIGLRNMAVADPLRFHYYLTAHYLKISLQNALHIYSTYTIYIYHISSFDPSMYEIRKIDDLAIDEQVLASPQLLFVYLYTNISNHSQWRYPYLFSYFLLPIFYFHLCTVSHRVCPYVQMAFPIPPPPHTLLLTRPTLSIHSLIHLYQLTHQGLHRKECEGLEVRVCSVRV